MSPETPTPFPLSRRRFLTSLGAVAAAGPLFSAAPAGGGASASAPAVARPRLRVGLVGCGGRGTGALGNFLEAAGLCGVDAEVVALADWFRDRVDGAVVKFGVDPARGHVGPLAYQAVMDGPADVVLLVTPPAFRPRHFEAAVAAGKHVFMEKPVAVDAAGALRIVAAGEEAKRRGLSVVAGTQRRYQHGYLRNAEAVHGGQIGRLTGGTVHWCQGALWFRRREAGQSDADYLVRNWISFAEMSGDHLVEQHVHQIDVANWFLGRHPESAVGFGGRARRQTGNQYDFFSVDFDYGDGVHVHAMARQIDGCYNRVGEYFTATGGEVHGGGRIVRADGRPVSLHPLSVHENPMVQEHAELLDAIVGGRPVNGARDVAEATLAAVMGRVAAYTGQVVRWSDLVDNAESPWYRFALTPSAEDFESGTVVAPPEDVVPVPGQAKA